MQYLQWGTHNKEGNNNSQLKHLSTVHHVKVRNCVIFDNFKRMIAQPQPTVDVTLYSVTCSSATTISPSGNINVQRQICNLFS